MTIKELFALGNLRSKKMITNLDFENQWSKIMARKNKMSTPKNTPENFGGV